jgi:hypothetical protein
MNDHSRSVSSSSSVSGSVTSVRICHARDHASGEVRQKAARKPVQPWFSDTIEMRLSGAETQERLVPVERAEPGRDVLAITGVRAFLTRHGEPAGRSSAIGGIAVRADLQEHGILCIVESSDFGPGDLIVVQMDVAVYRARS